jgi:cytochrome o ubiquinol oxidase subunit 2
MSKLKLFLIALSCVIAAALIYLALTSEKALVAHPRGLLAAAELKLIHTNIFLMLAIVVPTLVIFFWVAWRFRSMGLEVEHDSEKTYGGWVELSLWVVPFVVVVPMAMVTWEATHQLDPYRPIEDEGEALHVQVVAIDWKWLFIYPEQGIASVNLLQIPEKRPIRFELAADGSPMNSFWIPQLSGQIYTMTGMSTILHIMADGPGRFTGRAAEINGRGFSEMTFEVVSSSESDFESWVAFVKESPRPLTDVAYAELLQPSVNHPVALYSFVDKDFYHKIIMKYMHP